jgi:hypothetical protein
MKHQIPRPVFLLFPSNILLRLTGWLDAACCSNRAPTRRVRRRVVSTAGTSPSGRNSDNSVLARAYGSKDPIFAMTRSYSDVHRSGMISATGASVCRLVTAHWQGKNVALEPPLFRTKTTAAACGHP